MARVMIAILLSSCLFLTSGCTKKKSRQKIEISDISSQDAFQMLEGITLPFDFFIEQDMSVDATETAVFKIKIPPKKVNFLEEFFCNSMQQSGWLLQKKFVSQDGVIIDFCSLSRSCLIIIHRDAKKDFLSKKITLYIQFISF